ncbi:MAG: Crp/Fnr family transcriptional regulator [Deltaproteobacteria bacterium]|nr:Crp/Fnr family transcriptional regulator [Deltaproteobacteria bacterium]
MDGTRESLLRIEPSRVTGHVLTCPVRASGIEPRKACESCGGRPPSAQIVVEKRTVLYLEGDEARNTYAVVEGYLKESCTLVDGRAQGIRLVRPGDLIGLECLVGAPLQTTVEAVTKARVCVVSRAEVEATIRREPAQGLAISREISRQLVEVKTSMVRLGAMTAEERIESILKDLAPSRGSWVELPLSRQEIADLLGLALGTVSRGAQRMAREGRFEIRGRHIRIPT